MSTLTLKQNLKTKQFQSPSTPYSLPEHHLVHWPNTPSNCFKKEGSSFELRATRKAEPGVPQTALSSTFQEAVFILVNGLLELCSVGGLEIAAHSL
jgi:hypothetical protein